MAYHNGVVTQEGKMEVSKRWYLGSGKSGILRLKNIQKLADALFQGNVSKLVNDALDKQYDLNPETGAPRKPLAPPKSH
jgi:hypothetical protein